jgi:hypothetical protein
LPPEASIGFQVHYGPASYDTAVTQPFFSPGGDIRTDCLYLESPNTTDVYLNEYHLRARPGMHDGSVLALSSSHPDGVAPCDPGFNYRSLAWSPGLGAKDVPDVLAPENAGLAMRLAPNTQLALRLHTLNACCPLLREVWVNFVYENPSTITQLVDSLLHAKVGAATPLAANSQLVVNGSCAAPRAIRILDLSAQGTHRYAERATIWKVSGASRTLVYESYSPMEWETLSYDSVHTNTPPNPANSQGGGHDGVLQLAAGDRLEWECSLANTTIQNVTFDDSSPACVVQGRYVESTGAPWSCVEP